jgi:phosphomannomutase
VKSEVIPEPNGHFPQTRAFERTSNGYFRQGKADLGVVVDPDVDRLAFICSECVGEEYTLAACADYVLSKTLKYCF